MWEIKGEEFLKKLVAARVFLDAGFAPAGRCAGQRQNRRRLRPRPQSRSSPFVDAGLPLKPVPAPKEGLPASNGFGVLGVIKNPPHPNATKVFVNWFLGKEGQEWYGRKFGKWHAPSRCRNALAQKTRHQCGQGRHHRAGVHRVRNHLEDKYTKVRLPAGKVCRDDPAINVQGSRASPRVDVEVRGQKQPASNSSHSSKLS